MELIFLGTSSMVPTRDRNHSSILLLYGAEGLLFDCGEGTQRQLKHAGIKLTKITRIFISHWHGDHILGLPGLLQSLDASVYQGTLQIYGPKGTKRFLAGMLKAFACNLSLKFNVMEVERNVAVNEPLFSMEVQPLKHNVPNLGFLFKEKPKRKINLEYIKRHKIPIGPLLGQLQQGKTISCNGTKITPARATYTILGKKIAIVTDTLPCPAISKLARDSDLFVCEATYDSSLEQKAKEHMHMTAAQAAQMARKAQAKQLILTHFSVRYKDTSILEKEAKRIFANTKAAYDLMRVQL